MDRTLSKWVPDRDLTARASFTLLLLLLLVVGVVSVLNAISKPVWHDEIFTAALCRLPSNAEILDALRNAADSNPIGYHVMTRFVKQLVADEHLGLRLPSIFGLLTSICCVYFLLAKRVSRLSALFGAAFLLCTPLAEYGFEARPYSFTVGCIAVAILVWQRVEERPFYPLLLAMALAAALSTHYYAVLIWPIFGAAESLVLLRRRRLRWGVWAAFVAGLIPLALSWKILSAFKETMGPHFWARPSLTQLISTHDWLFLVGGHWGWTFTAGLTILLTGWMLEKAGVVAWPKQQVAELSPVPEEESVFALLLLWLPVVGLAVTILTHGGFTARYMIAATLGGALVLGLLADKLPPLFRSLLLLLFLMNYGLSSVEVLKSAATGKLLDRRAAAEQRAAYLLSKHSNLGLPVVNSSLFTYLERTFYTPPQAPARLYGLIDPVMALKFDGTDTIDRALTALGRSFPLQLVDYDVFTAQHSEFLLIVGGAGHFEWLGERILHDGHTLTLLSMEGSTRIYKVTLKSK